MAPTQTAQTTDRETVLRAMEASAREQRLAIELALRPLLADIPAVDAASDELKIAAIVAEQIRRAMAQFGMHI